METQETVLSIMVKAGFQTRWICKEDVEFFGEQGADSPLGKLAKDLIVVAGSVGIWRKTAWDSILELLSDEKMVTFGKN